MSHAGRESWENFYCYQVVNKRFIFGAYFGILNLIKYFEKEKISKHEISV